ncbi:biosynthetic peptidoglycan transglycosylase [uncultured Comamonas sp.]|uniref:biosynthetic peptidoglycan transglycosylase n=1 Tax=uncultured Comamonas sp. TaxID=114710 RepID=UPI0025FB5FEC|nr:biosynthetic peptidoglycan transglycosylase [uncultured Comamonas sp.]
MQRNFAITLLYFPFSVFFYLVAIASLKIYRRFEIDFKILEENIRNTELCEEKTEFVSKLIIAEDHRFLDHFGVDFIAMARAIYSTKIKGIFQGASTIEQQLTRTITARYERTLRRKLREQLLAVLISRKFSKYLIAKCYLENAYFGHGIKGIEIALRKLDNGEYENFSEFLVSLLKYPKPKFDSDEWERKIRNRIAYIKKRYAKYCCQ